MSTDDPKKKPENTTLDAQCLPHEVDKTHEADKTDEADKAQEAVHQTPKVDKISPSGAIDRKYFTGKLGDNFNTGNNSNNLTGNQEVVSDNKLDFGGSKQPTNCNNSNIGNNFNMGNNSNNLTGNQEVVSNNKLDFGGSKETTNRNNSNIGNNFNIGNNSNNLTGNKKRVCDNQLTF